MLKSLLILLVALLSLSQANFFSLNNISLSIKTDEAYGRQVTLTYILGAGYTMPVDFSKSLHIRGNMILNLHSSYTILTENCFNFNKYYCLQFASCKRDTSRTYNLNYPFFAAQGQIVQADVELDPFSWSLYRGAPALYVTSCNSQFTGSYGAGTFGMVGLGTIANAKYNFNRGINGFSVFFSQGAFRLEFNPNLNFPKNLIARFPTEASWNIPNIASIAIGTSVNRLSGVKAIFDINSDTIGLPLALFNAFIPALQTYNIYCPSGIFTQPICSFNGFYDNLPNILVSPDASTNIVITPRMYALDPSGNQFKLNIRALNSAMTGLNYVTKDYDATIVLGNTILGYYYTYFNLQTTSIEMYQVL